jgi:hypothetical protein
MLLGDPGSFASGALNLLSTDGRDTGVVHERDFSIK